MLIGDARVSKADGSQSLDLQHDALQAAGVDARHVLPRLRVRRPRRPPGARQLPARASDWRRGRGLEARPPRPHPCPPGQHCAGPVGQRRGPAGAHLARRADRHHHGRRPPRVRHLRALAEIPRNASPKFSKLFSACLSGSLLPYASELNCGTKRGGFARRGTRYRAAHRRVSANDQFPELAWRGR